MTIKVFTSAFGTLYINI